MRETERRANAMLRELLECALLLTLLHVASVDSVGQPPAASAWTGKAVVPKNRTFMMRDDNQSAPPRAGLPAI
jgi:hypothetical protein